MRACPTIEFKNVESLVKIKAVVPLIAQYDDGHHEILPIETLNIDGQTIRLGGGKLVDADPDLMEPGTGRKNIELIVCDRMPSRSEMLTNKKGESVPYDPKRHAIFIVEE